MAPSNFAEAKHLAKIVLNNFLIGTLAVLPIIVVAQIVIFLAHLILSTVFGVQEAVGNYGVTFLAFAGVFGLLTYIGHTVNKRRHSLVLSLVDLAIERVPFLNTVYRVTKKIVDMFRSRPDEQKREIVYVEYPREGMWLPAYVTNREGDRYVLYVPTSPNPTNGFTVIVHESKVVKSALDISEVTSFVMSVGSDFPKSQETLGLPR